MLIQQQLRDSDPSERSHIKSQQMSEKKIVSSKTFFDFIAYFFWS